MSSIVGSTTDYGDDIEHIDEDASSKVEPVLLALASGDLHAARQAADEAAGSTPLATALHRHLDRPAGDVYAEPSGFAAFIDNGGNVELYARTIALLRTHHRALAPATVLDIGCGDGRVSAATRVDAATHIDALEPSSALLADALVAIGSQCTGHNLHVATFLDQTDGQRWDLVQATYALHNLEPAERRRTLARLRDRTDHLLVAEFDVEPFAIGSREHARYAAQAYEHGIAEYPAHPSAIEGFLLPVLVAQFDPAQPSHTHEQSIAEWTTDLQTAGFSTVTTEPIVDYWWAPAVLVHATP